MATTWNTKYGARRVRHDPPTLTEAITAAQGLSDQLHEQIEIAAGLMDLSIEEVRAEVLKLEPSRGTARILAASGREGAPRSVIVERKVSRRLTRPAGVNQ